MTMNKNKQTSWKQTKKWMPILLATTCVFSTSTIFASAHSSSEGQIEPTGRSIMEAIPGIKDTPSLPLPHDTKSESGEEKQYHFVSMSPVDDVAWQTETYSMAYLNTLSYTDLVYLLVTVKWTQLPDLFKYNDEINSSMDSARITEAFI